MALIQDIEPPQEGLIYTNDNIQLKIGEKILESGILYITENSLSWKPHSRNEGITIPWKQISLHGISSNPAKYVYVMLDHKLQWEGVYDPGSNLNGNNADQGYHDDNGGGDANEQQQNQNVARDNASDDDNDEGNESDCEPYFTELWLIPSDTNCVDDIFQAMKECQALHPDSADSISDESNFMDAQDMDDNDNDDDDDDVGQSDMRNMNINDEKFADAEE